MKGWTGDGSSKTSNDLFQAGRNCCQAVVGAYCTELGITEEKQMSLRQVSAAVIIRGCAVH